MKVNDLAVSVLLASAGGAAGFSVNNPKNVAKGGPEVEGAQEVVKPNLEAMLGAPFPNLQKRAEDDIEQLKLRKEIYGSAKEALNLKNGKEFFYEEGGQLLDWKLKDSTIQKNAKEMNEVFAEEAGQLKRISASVATDKGEGIANQIVDKTLDLTAQNPAKAALYRYGALELLESASSRGLDLDRKDKNGKTPVEKAQEAGATEIVEDIESLLENKRERTPLENAKERFASKVEKVNEFEKKARDAVDPDRKVAGAIKDFLSSEVERGSKLVQFIKEKQANNTNTTFVELVSDSNNVTEANQTLSR